MKKLITAAVVALTFAGTAIADPISIDAGADYGGIAGVGGNNNSTGVLNFLNASYQSTSTVFDSNSNGLLDNGDVIQSTFGVNPSLFTSNPSAFFAAFSTNQINSFFPNENLITGSPSKNGYGGTNWNLTFSSSGVQGTYQNGEFKYTQGSITMHALIGTTSLINLFTVNINYSQYLPGNTFMSGSVASVTNDWFHEQVTGLSFANYNATHESPVRARFDLNTKGSTSPLGLANIINTSGLLASGSLSLNSLNNGQPFNHGGQVTFAVPEPTSIAILGLGLLGFAGVRRRKS